ncbi:hypothetical protein JZ751_014125 [Albula glossodonta]|uniref:Calsyntenin C-terminal domain-containing protein n=1 Tax=Albula glossodonta TaxID=121402 RepID=A0A8T2P0I6_9TELE|nr:hypothetical protein JZ751_014125 [Albula glossodonta]
MCEPRTEKTAQWTNKKGTRLLSGRQMGLCDLTLERRHAEGTKGLFSLYVCSALYGTPQLGRVDSVNLIDRPSPFVIPQALHSSGVEISDSCYMLFLTQYSASSDRLTNCERRVSKSAHRPGVIEILHNLDYCDVLVIGEELDPEQESLQVPRSALLEKHLDATNSTSGISIYGVDSMSHYEQVIQQVRYYNWHPGGLKERRFCVTCSELNGRYTSNEFSIEVRPGRHASGTHSLHRTYGERADGKWSQKLVSVLHRSQAVEHVNHMAVQSQYMRAIHHPVVVHSLNSVHGSGTPPVATAVIVMCIAALVVIVVLGIYRIHAAHQLGSKSGNGASKDKDMEWDESELTITVNPMENVQEPKAADEEASEEEEEEEDDDEDEEDDGLEDDITSMESEDSDEEEAGGSRGAQEGKSKGRLEWKTTLS